MSFLAGRLAAKEGAYFLQESKQAVNRLADKTPKFNTDDLSLPSSPESHADILPEVLKHSIPSKILTDNSSSSRSSAPLTASSKWSLHSSPSNSSPVSHDALNPLSAYVSLPQVTFGPKRWSLPSSEHSILASTANEMRKDRYAPVNPQKLKAATEGLAHIGKAFAVATLIVFGGATVVFALAASKLELHNINDIRAKGKDIVRPKFEMIKDQMVPLRTWAEDKSKKWHIEKEKGIKERAIVKELSKTLGTKTSS